MGKQGAINLRKVLIINTLIVFVFSGILPAQASNESTFNHLVKSWRQAHPAPFKSLTGFSTPTIDSIFVLDTTSQSALHIREPSIQYKRARKNAFQRKISVTLIERATATEQYELTHQDTIPGKSIRQIRKTKFDALKGEDPRIGKKFVLPAIGIISGISAVLTLFYFRSR